MMHHNNNRTKPDYAQALYILPFIVFSVLITLRHSSSYSYLFEWLPVLGRTLPFFILSALLVCVYKFRGGSLKQLGFRWPNQKQSKPKMLGWILLAGLAIVVARILIAVTLDPILELLPSDLAKSIDRKSPLADNLNLFFILLPLMWLVVIGEELMIRGLLMNYLAKRFGDTRGAWLLAILVSSIIFGLFHMGKGTAAMLQSGFGGLAYGVGYYVFKRNLWPVILAHALANSLGFLSAFFAD